MVRRALRQLTAKRLSYIYCSSIIALWAASTAGGLAWNSPLRLHKTPGAFRVSYYSADLGHGMLFLYRFPGDFLVNTAHPHPYARGGEVEQYLNAVRAEIAPPGWRIEYRPVWRDRLKYAASDLGFRWPDAHLSRTRFSEVRLVLGIPMWLMILPAAIFAAWTRWKHRRARKPGCCTCGYDLNGNTSGICPECGAKLPTTHAFAR